MCEKLGISRAAYYKWLNRPVQQYEEDNKTLAQLIIEYDERFGHILGYRRMADWINYYNGTEHSRKRVRRTMRKLGIHAVIRRKRRTHTYTTPETVAENILNRDFNASEPNEKWATDVTEFKVPNAIKQKLYLSAIIDLYDRSIVSYVVSCRNDNKLVFDTFYKAIAENPGSHAIFHSDRGFQYTGKYFKAQLEKQGMTQSMSRVGHCIDNGPTEGLWGIIKTEMSATNEITDEASLRAAIDKYIDFYNNVRIQERYGKKTPSQVRAEALQTKDPNQYPIAENKRIEKYKAKFVA